MTEFSELILIIFTFGRFETNAQLQGLSTPEFLWAIIFSAGLWALIVLSIREVLFSVVNRTYL